MKYRRIDYESFLQTELDSQTIEYDRLVNTKAKVLKEHGEVFVGKYLKLSANGMAVFKIRASENIPRKNSFWTAVFLTDEMGSFKNWNDLSWAELRKNYQKDFCDAYCAWISKSDELDFCLLGIKNLTLDFAELLEKNKPVLAFGPKDPPVQYLLNLIEIAKDDKSVTVNSILDFDQKDIQWNPIKVHSDENLTSLIFEKFKLENCLVIQGPPGTGKTYRMAKLASELLNLNKSVLVTALTNRALMELAKKDDLKQYILEEKVSKTSLTVDESRELPKIQKVVDNLPNAANGYLSLATFYISSEWAARAVEPSYDFLIVDEASQALLPMLAATMKLGRKVIWIGDQNQLSPIVLTNEDIINRYNWNLIVKGFGTICNNFKFSSYILSDTFRLTKRGAECTGMFYHNNLRSVTATQQIPSKLGYLKKEGGPVIINMDLKIGDKTPENAFDKIFLMIKDILDENPKTEIAVLSKFRETVRWLQKLFVIKSPYNEIPENVKIETVDRVQGLTVDYCIFFIPNASIKYSLEKELFNVATSRAKYNTIIVVDSHILQANMEEDVKRYILGAQEDRFVAFNDFTTKTITVGDKTLVTKGKIDLSKFERKRNELAANKKNIYIVDTNVFVKCPDIIDKIGRQYKIVVPTKVLEELDKLKLKESVDKKALNDAAKNINIAFTKDFSNLEDGDTSLLPAGFDKSNPDCMILSVALKYKDDNPILLTSDNILQARATGLNIKNLSLKEFLKC